MNTKWIFFLIFVIAFTFGLVDMILADNSAAYTYFGDKNESGLYHGEGKLYYQNHLIYEGEFADGKFHGEGILYYLKSNQIKYRGKFRNGQYYGYGFEYNENGEVIEQGYYINNQIMLYDGELDKEKRMHGTGKLYNPKTKELVYQGEFKHGEIHGKGKLYQDGHLYYKGEFFNDFIHGEGILYFPDGNISYKGEFVRNRTKQQPFQIKSKVTIYNNGKFDYSITVVLLEELKNQTTEQHLNQMKSEISNHDYEVSEIRESNYQGFQVTVADLLDSYQDDFLGVNIKIAKNNEVFRNHHRLQIDFPRFENNLINYSFELVLPDSSENISFSEQVYKYEENKHYVLVDISDIEQLTTEYGIINIPSVFIAIIGFLIPFIAISIHEYLVKDRRKVKI